MKIKVSIQYIFTFIMFAVFIVTLILITVLCCVLINLLSHSKMHVIWRLSTLCLL